MKASRRGLTQPGMFGVFYYRSANRKTLEPMLRYAHEHGTALRKVEISELFAKTVLEQPKT
mgnify:CR=1 FL=1